MSDQQTTYPVVIRGLPKKHLKEETDLRIFIRNCLKDCRKGEDCDEGTKKLQFEDAHSSRKTHSRDQASNETETESFGVDARIYCPVPCHVIRTYVKPTWRSDEFDTDGDDVEEVTSNMSAMSLSPHLGDQHDAVVEFFDKKDALLFGETCECGTEERSSKLFKVDLLFPEVFHRLKAEINMTSFEREGQNGILTPKQIENIMQKSGVRITESGKSGYCLTGKPWQLDIAQNLLYDLLRMAQFHSLPDEEGRGVASPGVKENTSFEYKEETTRNGSSKEQQPQLSQEGDPRCKDETDEQSMKQMKMQQSQRRPDKREKDVTSMRAKTSVEQKKESPENCPLLINSKEPKSEHNHEGDPPPMDEADKQSVKQIAANGQEVTRRKMGSPPAKRNSCEVNDEDTDPIDIKKAKRNGREITGDYPTDASENKNMDRYEKSRSSSQADRGASGQTTAAITDASQTIKTKRYHDEFQMKNSYWMYVKKENIFEKKIQQLIEKGQLETEEVQKDDKCILKIYGDNKQDLCKAKKYIIEVYDGYEFNLKECDVTKEVLESKMNVTQLEKRFSNLHFSPRCDKVDGGAKGIIVVGIQDEVDDFLKTILNDPQEDSETPTNSEPHVNESTAKAKKITLVESTKYEIHFNVLPEKWNFIRYHLKESLRQLGDTYSITTNELDEEEMTQVTFTTSDKHEADEIKNQFPILRSLLIEETINLENSEQANQVVDTLCGQIEKVIVKPEGSRVQIVCSREDSALLSDIIKDITCKSRPKQRERRIKLNGEVEPSAAPENICQGKPDTVSTLSNLKSKSWPAGFVLYGEIFVLIHKCDLTKMSVDAIVNAANDTLEHGGGVARVIAGRAGIALDRECHDIRKRGKLSVADVVTTTGGQLPCKKVMHAVGPEWYKYRNKQQCVAKLLEAFNNILEEARTHGFSSIAIPPVSSGIYRVPHEHVVSTMCKSLINNINPGHPTKVVHLVDVNNGLLDRIVAQLSSRVGAGKVGDVVELDHKKVEEMISDSVISLPCGFSMLEAFSIFVHKCDITKLNVDIVVSPTASSAWNKYGVQKAIFDAAGPQMKKEFDISCKGAIDSQVFATTGGSLRCDALYHAICPNWPKTKSKEKSAIEMLDMMYHNLWIKAKQSGIKSIAIPPIGIGQFGFPRNVVAEVICRTVASSMRDRNMINEIHIVDVRDEDVLLMLARLLKHTECMSILDQQIVEYQLQERRPSLASGNFRSHSVDSWEMLPNSSQGYSQPMGGARQKTYASVASQNPTSSGGDRLNRANSLDETDSGNRVFSSDYRQQNKQNAQSKSSSQAGASGPTDKQKGKSGRDQSDSKDEDNCPICMCPVSEPRKVLKCKHAFCKDCIDRAYKANGPKCPICGEIHGKVTGTQPKGGTMSHYRTSYNCLPGYQGCGTITINYNIPSGTQQKEHPNPGQYYSGVHRTAYLPDNREGNEILTLLKKAFDARLIFTVGTSTTTGATNQVTWNDIHHKTNMTGGPSNFGYPDAGYLKRVRDELAAKGFK